MRYLLVLLLLVFSFQMNAQRLFNGTKKISNAKGTFLMSWGYNRSFYTTNDIQFKSKSYDFYLTKVLASDKKAADFGEYFALKTMFKTQLNLNFAYYYKNRYAFRLGVTNMKYIMNDGNQVSLNGHIDTNLHAIWSGDYQNQQVITNATDFHYANDGMTYIRLGVFRTDKLYQSKSKIFALSSSYGVETGTIVSNNTFNFAHKSTSNVRSLSGYALNVFASMRLEFFRQFFIQGELVGGSINQTHVKTSPDIAETYAKQQFWFGQRNISFGFFYYFKPGNVCSDCPVW